MSVGGNNRYKSGQIGENLIINLINNKNPQIIELFKNQNILNIKNAKKTGFDHSSKEDVIVESDKGEIQVQIKRVSNNKITFYSSNNPISMGFLNGEKIFKFLSKSNLIKQKDKNLLKEARDFVRKNAKMILEKSLKPNEQKWFIYIKYLYEKSEIYLFKTKDLINWILINSDWDYIYKSERTGLFFKKGVYIYKGSGLETVQICCQSSVIDEMIENNKIKSMTIWEAGSRNTSEIDIKLKILDFIPDLIKFCKINKISEIDKNTSEIIKNIIKMDIN